MKTFAEAAHREENLERLLRVAPDSTRRWGRMTGPPMICHCADACRMARGEAAIVEVSSVLRRSLVKWVALYAPMRWPSGIQTVQELDQRTAGTAPSDFEADRAALAALLGTLVARPDGPAWPRHPIFGRMSERAWLRWAWLHMDHHLRQFGA